MIRKEDAWPLGALTFILGVSAAWWAFALWAVPSAPAWFERARSVCFNITESGLPDAKGWLLLIGQPPTMLAALMVGWGRQVRASVRHLGSSTSGRTALVTCAGAVVLGLGLAGWKVADARLPETAWGAPELAQGDPPRLDRPWPAASGLVDHRGDPFGLEALAGRPALVMFAFGHCATLCPVVVQAARAARDEAAPGAAVVVVTLDPWRDTPGLLASVLEHFGLDPARDFVVGGPVESVEAALDAWDMTRTRDPRTGDIVHPGIVYLVEADGTVAHGVTGGPEQLSSLLGRLPGS
ncbi:MAG: SCO family protein [Gemmatimonadetes bacterium]|nr:SCO family protein [Gemmatimonadota bacterium]